MNAPANQCTRWLTQLDYVASMRFAAVNLSGRTYANLGKLENIEAEIENAVATEIQRLKDMKLKGEVRLCVFLSASNVPS